MFTEHLLCAQYFDATQRYCNNQALREVPGKDTLFHPADLQNSDHAPLIVLTFRFDRC